MNFAVKDTQLKKMILNFKKKNVYIKKILKRNLLLEKVYFNSRNQRKISKNNFTTFDYGVEGKSNEKYIQAAVLVPIIFKKKKPFLLLTKRSSFLKSHPGQISFPGGKVEKTDTTFLDAAFRESYEEVGLKKNNFIFLDRFPKHITISGFEINPFLVLMKKKQSFIKNKSEVEEIIKVPLEFLLKIENFHVRCIVNKKKKRKYYTIPYGHHYIWGATAQIIRSFAERLENEH